MLDGRDNGQRNDDDSQRRSSALLSFGIDGTAAEYLRAGWSRPEPGYTWTQGSRASLELPRVDAASDYRLRLAVHLVFTPKDRPWQRVAIGVDGRPLACLVIGGRGTVDIWMPKSAIGATDRPATLQFELPDAARPKDFGNANDARMLAIALRELRLEPLLLDGQAHDTKRIAWSVESLGFNCEVGLMQRRAGAEPLGLLRFATSRMSALIPALDANFAHLGDPDDLDLVIHGTNGREEWMILEQRYGFVIHTHTSPTQATAEQIRRRESRRLRRLAEKLMEDLRDAEKLFVYQGDGLVSPEDAEPLLRALRRHGPVTLLAVFADPSRVGKAYRESDNLLVGYVDALHSPAEESLICLDAWQRLLGAAHALWQAGVGSHLGPSQSADTQAIRGLMAAVSTGT
jgi:hypothetical protein